MSMLPEELWRGILEVGIKSGGFTYKDLCRISICCRLLYRLSHEEALWSQLLLFDFPSSSSSSVKSKSLYRISYERERKKKLAADRRAVLRKESEIAEHFRKLGMMETALVQEMENMRATLAQLSDLGKMRGASVALKAWQPEVIRSRHKQIVEQCPVGLQSRIHSLNLELRLCNHNISMFRTALKYEKQRLDIANQELVSLQYHPSRDYKAFVTVSVDNQTNIKRIKKKKTSIPEYD